MTNLNSIPPHSYFLTLLFQWISRSLDMKSLLLVDFRAGSLAKRQHRKLPVRATTCHGNQARVTRAQVDTLRGELPNGC